MILDGNHNQIIYDLLAAAGLEDKAIAARIKHAETRLMTQIIQKNTGVEHMLDICEDELKSAGCNPTRWDALHLFNLIIANYGIKKKEKDDSISTERDIGNTYS